MAEVPTPRFLASVIGIPISRFNPLRGQAYTLDTIIPLDTAEKSSRRNDYKASLARPNGGRERTDLSRV